MFVTGIWLDLVHCLVHNLLMEVNVHEAKRTFPNYCNEWLLGKKSSLPSWSSSGEADTSAHATGEEASGLSERRNMDGGRL